MAESTLLPHLVVIGGADAIAFYEKAFSAVELFRMPNESGKLMHATIEINGAQLYLCDEFPGSAVRSPKSLGGTSIQLHLNVPDTDAAFARAVDAGATAVMEPRIMPWGHRYALVDDPFGHRWSLSTPVENLNANEIKERLKADELDCAEKAPEPHG